MKSNYIKVIGFFIITFFFFSITHSYAEDNADDFPKNEKRYNVDRMKIDSLKELEGKLITSDDGKVVRLVDANHNGKVLVNDGVVPEAVTVYDNIEEATKVELKAAAQVCSDPDYIKFLKKKGVPGSTVYKKKTYKLNANLTRQYKVIVYGKPSNIANNSYKKGEYEFLGFGKNGGWVMNHKYPVQALSEKGPEASTFLLTDYFTGAAEDAGQLNLVYSGQANYTSAKATIEQFNTKWGWKLTDKKAASWWLNESSPKIKLQGLYTDWYAGLGITQYKSATTKKNWYQTYMIKPKIPTECEDEKDDVAAMKLKGIYKGGKVIADFTIQNNDPEKESLNTPKNIPWSLEWSYTGYDSKGTIKTKTGTISNTKSYYPTKLPYQINKVQSYTLDTGIKSSWGGTITLKAKWNPSCSSGSGFKETNCNNNTATTTVTFKPTSDGGEKCDPAPLEYNFEYEYEYDLAVDKVQAYTAEAGKKTKVITTVSRKDFSNKWGPVLERLKAKNKEALDDLNKKEKAEKAAFKKLSDDETAYNKAPSKIESCEGKGKDKVCKDIPNPEKARLAAVVEADKIAYDKAYCDYLIADNYYHKTSLEYGNLYWPVNNYKELHTIIFVSHENQKIPNQTWVNLKEGETYVYDIDNFEVDEEDSTVRAEVNPVYEAYTGAEPGRWYEDEFTFDNNELDTQLYVSSHEQACAPPGEEITMEGVVRTTTTSEGTKEDVEVLKGKVINQTTSKIKAGYGFGFENQTSYTNPIATSQEKGVESMDSRFDTLPNHLEYEVEDGLYKVPNEKKSGSTPNIQSATAIWQLPSIYVEKHSGNLFNGDYVSNPNRNSNDTILDGGRKWYVDFDETDRIYPFVSYSGETGINKMTLCLMGEVEVKGAILKNEVYDESDNSKEGEAAFILRTIQPNNPFPGGVGWNWTGKTSSISGLNSWWNGSSSSNGNEILLTPSKVKQIRNYNKSNEIKDIKPNYYFNSTIAQ